jgi:hypothetical protein
VSYKNQELFTLREHLSSPPGKIKFGAKKIPNFLPGTLTFYRIVDISNDHVYIILPENTHQCLFTAADNSPWNIFHSRFAIFRRHF